MNLARTRAMPALALAGAVLAGVPVRAASERDALIARWAGAGHAAIVSSTTAKKLPAALATFTKLQAQLDASPSPAAGPADLGALAQRELNVAGRYRLTEKIAPPPDESWWQRGLQWLGDRFKQIWDALFSRVKVGKGGAMAIGDLMIALALLVLLLVGWRLVAQLQLERRSRGNGVESLGTQLDAGAVYREAQRRAADGDYGMAARLLFVATVLSLDLAGVLADSPSATVGDLRHALRARDAAKVSSFDPIASAFVTSAYAERAIERGEWQRAHDAYLALVPSESP